MTDRGDLFADELLTWVKTPMVWQQSVKGIGGGCDCKMLMAGAARELGFPEANSIYAMMADYSPRKPVDTKLMTEGMERLFDRLPASTDLRRGDILQVKMKGRPQHLAGVTEAGADGKVVHVQIGPKDWVKETRLDVFLRAYPLFAVYRWKAEA